MSIPTLLTQVAITLLVVMLYHLWVSRKKPPAPAPPAVLAPVAAPPKTPPPAQPVSSETISPETVAVIAAAIAVVLGREHRVLSMQQAAAQTPDVNVWALEGRMQQFMSHKVR